MIDKDISESFFMTQLGWQKLQYSDWQGKFWIILYDSAGMAEAIGIVIDKGSSESFFMTQLGWQKL